MNESRRRGAAGSAGWRKRLLLLLLLTARERAWSREGHQEHAHVQEMWSWHRELERSFRDCAPSPLARHSFWTD